MAANDFREVGGPRRGSAPQCLTAVPMAPRAAVSTSPRLASI